MPVTRAWNRLSLEFAIPSVFRLRRLELWLRAAALPALWIAARSEGERVSHLPSICVWKLATGWDCPGCGMGRALIAAFRGDFVGAWHLHRLVFVAIVCLACSSWEAVRALRVEA